MVKQILRTTSLFSLFGMVLFPAIAGPCDGLSVNTGYVCQNNSVVGVVRTASVYPSERQCLRQGTPPPDVFWIASGPTACLNGAPIQGFQNGGCLDSRSVSYGNSSSVCWTRPMPGTTNGICVYLVNSPANYPPSTNPCQPPANPPMSSTTPPATHQVTFNITVTPQNGFDVAQVTPLQLYVEIRLTGSIGTTIEQSPLTLTSGVITLPTTGWPTDADVSGVSVVVYYMGPQGMPQYTTLFGASQTVTVTSSTTQVQLGVTLGPP